MKRKSCSETTTILSSSEEEVDYSPLICSHQDPKIPPYDIGVVKPQLKPAPKDEHLRRHHCRMPLHVSLERKRYVESHSGERLLLQKDREWETGTELTWSLIEDAPYEGDEDMIVQAFEEWSKICHIKFKKLQDKDMEAQIRIGFDDKDGCWSYVGQSILKTKYHGQRTMNFGCALFNRLNIALHEIGHTLGFPHEHQNKNSGIVWNDQAVYEEMHKTQGWDQQTVKHNILKTYDGVHESEWDPESIMNYEFGPDLILFPEKYRQGIKRQETFSKLDRELALKFYPFPIGVQPISVLTVEDGSGILKVKLRKGETNIIQLQFKSPLPEFGVSVLPPHIPVEIIVKDGTKTLASGSSGNPIQLKGCDEMWECVVELKSQAPSNQNELLVTVVVFSQ